MEVKVTIDDIQAMKTQCSRPPVWRDRDEWEGRYYVFETRCGDIWLDPRCPCCARFFSQGTVKVYVNFADKAEVFGECRKCGPMQPDYLWGE